MSRGSDFAARYGPWALVAGGSEGLGAAYARELAARGLSLVVVAETEAPLEATCRRIADETGATVRPAWVDLARPDVIDALRAHTDGLEIGLVVYNAAVSFVGRFLDQPVESALAALDVNCRGALLVAHAYAGPMVERGRGGLLFMTSMAGMQGTPLVATYAATKAFDLVLGESLWDELREAGVDVLSVCGGPIRTPGFERTRPDLSGRLSPAVMEPDAVAREALDALGAGPSRVMGRANRWSAALLQRWMPRRRAIELMGRTMRRQFAPQAAGRQPGS